MISFIVRRTLYSVLIVAGVVLLTFLLFNVSSGDPAAALLGKDARPEEIDSLRRELGGDLPLIYGRYCRSEVFPQWQNNVPAATVELKRNFPLEMAVAVVTLKSGRVCKIPLPVAQEVWKYTAPAGEMITCVKFYRIQKNPWNSQFFRSLGEIISWSNEFPYLKCFNFGNTLNSKEPIRELLWRGMWPSLALMIPIFFGEIWFGILFALIAVAFVNRWPDRLLVLLSVAGLSISYLVAIVFGQWLLGYYLEWFPLWGFESLRSLGLPVVIGIICGVGSQTRFFRTVFIDELRKEYLRTAVAKGVSPYKLYGKHLLRNASIQIITRASAGLPFLFTGSLLLESFFGIPGLGFAGVEALYNSDIQLLKALVVLNALLFTLINLLADVAYAWADPRVRLN